MRSHRGIFPKSPSIHKEGTNKMTTVRFQTLNFDFVSATGAEQKLQKNAIFPSNVLHASAAIGGFAIGYTNSDHHLWKQTINVKLEPVQNVVPVEVTYLLRDSSGDVDDPYDGTIDVLVIAECVS
jgi:hypothetical protein